MAFKRLLPVVAFVLISLSGAKLHAASSGSISGGMGYYSTYFESSEKYGWYVLCKMDGLYYKAWGQYTTSSTFPGYSGTWYYSPLSSLSSFQANLDEDTLAAIEEAMSDSDYDGDGQSDWHELTNDDGDYDDPDVQSATPEVQEYDPTSDTQDIDGDGLVNSEDPDDDDDGIPDEADLTPGDTENPSVDTDGDGQGDDFETAMGSDPENPDSYANTDLDGVQINIENGHVTSVLPIDADGNVDTDGDVDGDGIINSEDTDNNDNGIDDWDELYWGQNPLGESSLTDSDGDGYSDKTEEAFGTDPDSAGSHPYDGWQPADGTVSSDALELDTDTDGDGQSDIVEWFFGTDPNDASSSLADTDGDGAPDKAENYVGTDPDNSSSTPPSDYDTTSGSPNVDPTEDNDLDGATNWEEFASGTDMNDDTDTPSSDQIASIGDMPIYINWSESESEDDDDDDDDDELEGGSASTFSLDLDEDISAIAQCVGALGLSTAFLTTYEAADYSTDIEIPCGGSLNGASFPTIEWMSVNVQLNPDFMDDGTAKDVCTLCRDVIHSICLLMMSIMFLASMWRMLWSL